MWSFILTLILSYLFFWALLGPITATESTALIISLLSLATFGLLFSVLFIPAEVWENKNSFKKFTNKLQFFSVSQEQEQVSPPIYLKPFFVFLKIYRLKPEHPKYKKIKRQLQFLQLDKNWTVEVIIAAKFFCVFCSTIYGLLLYLMIGGLEIIGVILILILGSFWVPEELLKIKTARRQQQLRKELPTVLHTMAILMEAGLTFKSALEEVSKRKKGILAQEFGEVLNAMHMGMSQKEALQNMAIKCEVTELSLFVSALVQGLEKGSAGVAELLKNQAQESWSKRKQQAEKLAQQASIKLFFPLLLLAFPAMMIFLLGPIVISMLQFFF